MTKIELHVRKVILAERIQQITAELIALMDETPRDVERNALHLAGVHLNQASKGLLNETAASLDLEAMLHLSIVSVQQKRCAELGSESQQIEKAHGQVSPFLKR